MRITRRSCAELREERVAGELLAEGGLRAVAGIDDRLRREAVGDAAHGLEQRLPVASGQVDPADRAREEQVAAEQAAFRVVRDVCRRVARDGDALEGQAGDLDRLAAGEEVVGRVGTAPGPRGRELA